MSKRILHESELHADTIFKWVKEDAWKLKEMGEIDIPLYGTPQELLDIYHIKAYCKGEKLISVEYGDKEVEVPCDLSSDNMDYIARCVMQGFARIYLNGEGKPGKTIAHRIPDAKNESRNSRIDRIIKESIKKAIEEGLNNQPEYSHYAVNKATNKIVYSWAYGDIEGSELRQFKRDYFIVDLTDNDLDPKQYTILSKAALLRRGIDPDDDTNWSQN